ncbi:hypothetical protein MJT46_012116 [Ovis ammon polii x Ovis aries]|nr:hypothetical protein MJT46_012116 [Ovis ammon polii x Ovis aries]
MYINCRGPERRSSVLTSLPLSRVTRQPGSYDKTESISLTSVTVKTDPSNIGYHFQRWCRVSVSYSNSGDVDGLNLIDLDYPRGTLQSRGGVESTVDPREVQAEALGLPSPVHCGDTCPTPLVYFIKASFFRNWLQSYPNCILIDKEDFARPYPGGSFSEPRE